MNQKSVDLTEESSSDSLPHHAIWIFPIIGPGAVVIFLALIGNYFPFSPHGNEKAALAFMLIFSYGIGFIPAIIAGALFVLIYRVLLWAGATKKLMLLPSVLAGAAAGFIPAIIFGGQISGKILPDHMALTFASYVCVPASIFSALVTFVFHSIGRT